MNTTLKEVAANVIVKDGGKWPLNPETQQPICDRCDNDAIRVAYSTPGEQGAVFFCGECQENDPCDYAPIVRRDGDQHAPLVAEQLNEAINRSISHTERVYLTVEADDISQAIASIGGEWDIDYCRENDGSYDVWGSVPDSDSDSMTWRLCVTIEKGSKGSK